MKKERLPEPTIKRSRAAELLGGVCARTMRRYEVSGALIPIKLNQRVTLYRRSEVEKILRGEIAVSEKQCAIVAAGADFKRPISGGSMKVPYKKLSGSARRKIFEIANQCGKFAPRLIARRRERKGLYAGL